jgi:hypothetical protein
MAERPAGDVYTISWPRHHISIAMDETCATICAQIRTLDQAARTPYYKQHYLVREHCFPPFFLSHLNTDLYISITKLVFSVSIIILCISCIKCVITGFRRRVNNLHSSGILRSIARYRRFGTTYRSHLQRSSTLLLGLLDPWRRDQ